MTKITRSFNRAPALLGLGLLCAMGAAFIDTRCAHDMEHVIKARAAVHVVAAKIPMKQFELDRANILSGTILSEEGTPIAGARIAVYSASELRHLGAQCRPTLYSPFAPEAKGVSDESGHYSFTGLSYGAKVLTFKADTFTTQQVIDVLLADGMGAQAPLQVMRRQVPSMRRFINKEGGPAEGICVRLLAESFAEPDLQVSTNSDGEVAVERAHTSKKLAALVGMPPCYVELSNEREVMLPALTTLDLTAYGAVDGTVDVDIYPHKAKRIGQTLLSAAVKNNRVERIVLYCGRYTMRVSQGDRFVWFDILEKADAVVPITVNLVEPQELVVQVQDDACLPLNATVAWQMWPLVKPDVAAAPHALIEAFDPTRCQTTTDVTGIAYFDGVPCDQGWLIVEAAGYAPAVLSVTTNNPIVVSLERGTVTSFRSAFPYQQLIIEPDAGPFQSGRTGAFTELTARLPSGPSIARMRLALGKLSYPKGVWVGSGDNRVAFSQLDEPVGQSGAIYGFVSDHLGHPVVNAQVFLAGGDRRLPRTAETDSDGFYRFDGLIVSEYIVGARPSGVEPAVASMLVVPHVMSVEENVGGWNYRADLMLYPGAVEVRGAPPGQLGMELRTDDGQPLMWMKIEDGRTEARNLPPGQYRVVLAGDSSALPQKTAVFSIDNENSMPLTVEWE